MNTMRLAVDCRMLSSSGIGRYLREVLYRLPDRLDGWEFALFGTPEAIESYLTGVGFPRSRAKIYRYQTRIYSFSEQASGGRPFRGVAPNVVFFPHYNVPLGLSVPFVVTIHDLTHLRFPGVFGWRSTVARRVIASALKRAQAVITGSESTKRDLESSFRVSPTVLIAPYGVSHHFSQASRAEIAELYQTRLSLPARYVLSVGNRKPHKNLIVAGQAVELARRQIPDLGWVVVGERYRQTDDVDAFRPRLGQSLVELEHVSDAELRVLYSAALALLMPSRWEGFGLPVLEAFRCGTPVVASDAAALVEVAGGAAIHCRCDDPAAFARGIVGLAEDDGPRQALQGRGAERASAFSWEDTADTLASAILRR